MVKFPFPLQQVVCYPPIIIYSYFYEDVCLKLHSTVLYTDI